MPTPFLTVHVHDLAISPRLTGLCAGFENGEWRCSQLVHYLLSHLVPFASLPHEAGPIDPESVYERMRDAANLLNRHGVTRRRGELGELILYAILTDHFNSTPAISKIYFKTNANDHAKGFDAVHVVSGANGLELWLGEVKLYKSVNTAIRSVLAELKEHTDYDYLRSEFGLILRKVDKAWPHEQALRDLIHRHIPMEKIFARVCIPVALVYDSRTVQKERTLQDYVAAFTKEVRRLHGTFAKAKLPNVAVHLILLPVASKERLERLFYERIMPLQQP